MVPVFWISLIGLVYIYVGYPALVWLRARICPRPIDGTRDPGGPVAVILVAHNEAEVLTEKIQSVLASTIADRIVEIVVASDASTDATQEVVARLSDPRIRCMAFADRRGKAACLNDAVGSSEAPILILTDARQWVAPDALEKLVCCLGDASVGVASGELVFRRPSSPGATGQGMGVYWRYERFIRLQESLVGSVPGATGALYALRREQFRKLPEDLILDDVFLPMRVIEQGYRCVLTPGAFVYDRVSETSREEWARKRRTQAGCVQLIQRYPRWLLRGAFFSHKAARLLSPLLLIGFLASSWWVCRWVFWIQALLYVAAALSRTLLALGVRLPLLGPGIHFVEMNLAALVGLWDGLRGRYTPAWKNA